MNISIKKENKASSVYTSTPKAKKARRTQRINQLKLKFKSIDIGELICVSFAIAIIIGTIVGFITTLIKPMGLSDTPTSRFFEILLLTFGGMLAGAGIVFLILVFGVCLVAIVRFISKLGAK